MALVVKDRVRDTTTTAGTGAITLSGTAPLRYRAFASVCSTSDTFPYAIVHQSVGVDEWEVGIGTLTASTTFARTTVVAGTNGTSAVVFSAGTKDVMMVDLADPLTLRTITGTAGQITVTNGDAVAGDPTIALATGLATLPTFQIFTSGSGTYTTPANVKRIRVRMVGGGGGGVGGGSTAGTVPTAGGNSTFGTSLLVANGGGIGVWANFSAGVGGTASLGSGPVGMAFSGGGGNPPTNSQASSDNGGGVGGSSAFGGGGTGGTQTTAGGNGATNTGAGGGGGGNNAATGQGGGGGAAGGYVEAFIASPLATYAYAVGAAGTAGGAGTTGVAGGAGGSGFIIVEEYYNY